MSAGASWKGTDRYQIVGRLGDGGMGVVYEAIDHERRERVALKTLRHFDADSLYRFKQEFRTLADVLHPNLVHLYELVADDKDAVFFTMELVEGCDFLSYVRGSETTRSAPESQVLNIPLERRENPARGPANPQSRGPASQRPAGGFDRIRRAMVQLVKGVSALHAAGKLHRDLKPSNVRVTPDARVVILDFGVATELRRSSSAEEANGEIVGTAAYMAPDQALGQAPAPAGDWYSVGAMLYEAIVGEPLHVGSPLEVMAVKCVADPTPPSARVEGVPEDLDALCLDLLSLDPAKRPTGAQVLVRLGATPSARAPADPIAEPFAGERLVGRETHLEALRGTFDRTRKGCAVWARVAGASGMGKTALAHHFLVDLEKRGDVLVLRGRAYERESVPFKAFDSVVDALCRHLIELEEKGQALPLPPDMEAVARVFPVLRRVPSIEKLAPSKLDDPRTLRQRAFSALRELFASLTHRGPVVIHIDDVHWGDVDSAALMLELVRPPGEPALLVLTTHPSEHADASPFLTEVSARWPEGAEVREVEVGRLERADASRLALALLERSDAFAERIAEKVARESQGNPFLIVELVRSTLAADDQRTIHGLTLEQMVEERTGRLPGDARHLLELIAIDGRPLPMSVVRDAGGMADKAPQLVAVLQSSRFVRVSLHDGKEYVEVVHDRVRERLLDQVSAKDARRHHAQLARVLQLASAPDHEAIATHLLGAGDREEASRYAEHAADQAVAKLAFAQAARLFQLAIDTKATSSPTESHSLRLRLARASEWAGHAEKAARAYLDAAPHAAAGERVELERAAAAQLIASGRIDEGVSAFHRVLAELGIALPTAQFWILLFTAMYRLVGGLLLRLAFAEKEKLPPDKPDKERRLDALYAMSRALSIVDAASSHYLKARYLCEALRSGNRFHVIRCIILEAGAIGGFGKRGERKERAMLAMARSLAEASKDEAALGQYDLTYGIGEYLRGRWRSCVESIERAQVRLTAVRAWHANAGVFRVYALVALGELPEVKTQTKALLADAERRGDRYTIANLRASHPVAVWLAADDLETARSQLKAAIADWSKAKFFVQHWQVMLWEAETHLYAGEGEAARQRLARDQRQFKTSSLERTQLVRSLTLFVRGRSAVASLTGLDGPERRTRVREAQRAHQLLKREAMPWTSALAAMLGASAAMAAKDSAGAQRELRRAIMLADRAEMALHAAAARHRLGLLLGGESGATLLAEAEAAMRARGVRVPARYAQMLMPGEWPAALAT